MFCTKMAIQIVGFFAITKKIYEVNVAFELKLKIIFKNQNMFMDARAKV